MVPAFVKTVVYKGRQTWKQLTIIEWACRIRVFVEGCYGCHRNIEKDGKVRKLNLLYGGITFCHLFIYSVNIIRHQQSPLHCVKAQKYNPRRGMANKQSQFSAIDTKAEMCTGSRGMERKDTSAQKQETRECLQWKLSLRQGKGLQQRTSAIQGTQVCGVARAWVSRRSYGGKESGEIGREQIDHL